MRHLFKSANHTWRKALLGLSAPAVPLTRQRRHRSQGLRAQPAGPARGARLPRAALPAAQCGAFRASLPSTHSHTGRHTDTDTHTGPNQPPTDDHFSTLSHTHTYRCTRAHTHTHTHTHGLTNHPRMTTSPHTHTHTQEHIDAHTQTHSHRQTHTHRA